MRPFKNILYISFLLLQVSSAGCKNKYMPGFDFILFKDTPAKELADAVESDDTLLIRKLIIEKKINIDYQEAKYGHTLLILAVINSNFNTIRTLLELGANPNTRYKDNSTPFIIFCEYFSFRKNGLDILKTMIDYGGDVNAEECNQYTDEFGIKRSYWTTALIQVCISADSIEPVKILVDKGADISKTLNKSYGAISASLIHDKLFITRYFVIEKKAKIPDYCLVTVTGVKKTLTDMLNESKYGKNSEQYKIKEELLQYLKSIGINK